MNFIQKNGSAKTLKEINLRKGKPSTIGDPTKIALGAILKFVGWVTDGESVSGNSKWFKTAEDNYFWSSYQDYAEKNRWGNLLKSEVILSQFSDKTEYKNFVETSGAKEMNKELEIDC